MAFYIYNDPTLLPPTGPSEGDEAFVVSNNKGYLFTDLSSILSYSYAFSQAGSLIVDSALSSISNNTFSIDFWSYTQTLPDRSFFTFDAKEKVTTVSEISRGIPLDSEGSIPVLSTSPFTNSYSLYFDGNDNVIKIDQGAENINILKPYTIEFWARSTKNQSGSLFNMRDTFTGITSVEKNKIVYNGVDFTLDNPVHVLDSWEHHAVSFDGFDHRYFNNGSEVNTTIQSRYSFSPGNINLSDFANFYDAGFQFKTLIPTSITDGTLFSLGSGNLGTSLSVSSSGTTITLSSKDLTVSTSTFPKDSAEHVFSWDYQIDPKRIRLFIDGDLVGSSTGSSPMTNVKWAEGAAVNFEQFVVDPSDVQELPYNPYYGVYPPGSYYGVNPFTRVSGGNLYINTRENRFYVTASINGPNSTFINPNGNKLYYFEWYPVGTATSSPISPFVYSRQSTLVNLDLFSSYYWGVYPYSYRKNADGLSINRLNHVYYPSTYRINSIIVDEAAGRIYNFSNGTYLSSDNISSSNMITPDTFSLGFVCWQYQYGSLSLDPNHETKFTFNKNEWIFDPSELYGKVAVASGTSGEFGGAASPSWFSDNVSDLRYYPQSFKNEYTSVSVGSKIYDTTYDRSGLQYAQQYVSSSGGSLITYSGGSDITSTIASLSDGDALVLPAGNYVAYGVRENEYHSSLFGKKSILICGQTNNPSDVLIEYYPDDTLRDTPIFGLSSAKQNEIAYLTLKRLGRLRNNSYEIALFQSGKGGKAYRVIFDLDGKNISWLYDYTSLPIKRYVIECSFKNYNNWYTYYTGSIGDFYVIGCKFSKDFRDQTSINNLGKNETYCTFSNSTSRNLEFEGCLYDIALSSTNLYDSDFTPSKKTVDPSTEILIDQDRKGDNLINIRADGKLIVNDRIVDSMYYPLNDWIHHAVSYDDSTLRIYKDGNLVSSVVTDLDGFLLNNSVLKIGRDDRLNTITSGYDKTYYTGNIKDLSLKNQLTSYTVPTEDKIIKDLNDVIFTGGKESPPGDVNITYDGTGISSVLFSPYTETTKGWIPSFLVSPAYTSVSVGTVDGTTLHLFDFDSTSFFDSNINFELYIKMTNKDDLGDSIGWNYEFMIPNQTVKIAKRGNNEFLIKRDHNSSFIDYSDYNSSLYITSFKTDSPDIPGTFAPIPQVSDRVENHHGVVIQYDRLFTYIDTTLSPIPLRMISQIDLLDSTFDETGFTYDSIYDYDILNNDRHFRIFDSLGELPT